MILGKVIRETRIKSGMTQQQVCDFVSITQGYYCSIEQGVVIPSFDVLTAIAHAFNIPLFYLIWIATERNDLTNHQWKLFKEIQPSLEEILNEK